MTVHISSSDTNSPSIPSLDLLTPRTCSNDLPYTDGLLTSQHSLRQGQNRSEMCSLQNASSMHVPSGATWLGKKPWKVETLESSGLSQEAAT